MGTLLVKSVSHIVTLNDRDSVFQDADILVEDGMIKQIGKVGEIKGRHVRMIDGRGMAMYPGLVNTHHHFYQLFTRNIRDVQDMELFPWLKYLYELWKNVDEEIVYNSSILGMAELLKSGCTTAVDHHYVFPRGSGDFVARQFDAASRLGIRFMATRGSMDLSVKDGGLPPDSVVQTIDEIMEDSERLVVKFHDPSELSMRMVALAPCSPFSVSLDLLRESAKLARRLNVRLHTHLAETKDEEAYTTERFGMRPLEYMESLGWIGDDVWYAHGIHFNDEEIRRLAETGTGVCHCPVSNMKLSSGICRVPAMLREGVKVGLGVDGSASNDGSNLMEELRTGYLLHRLSSSFEAPSGYEMLKIATKGSASLIGREDIGEISEGKAADFFMIDLSSLEAVGAEGDPADFLGTVGWKKPVDYTVVNGEVVVDKGRLAKADEGEITREVGASYRRFIERSGR